MSDQDLLEAFEKLVTGGELIGAHRTALLDHLKVTLPKAERKALLDKALVKTIEQLCQEGHELYPRPHGAIDTAARRHKVGFSSAAKVWKAYQECQEGREWDLFLRNRNF